MEYRRKDREHYKDKIHKNYLANYSDKVKNLTIEISVGRELY